MQPTTVNRRQATANRQPTAGNCQQAADNDQQVNEQQRATVITEAAKRDSATGKGEAPEALPAPKEVHAEAQQGRGLEGAVQADQEGVVKGLHGMQLAKGTGMEGRWDMRSGGGFGVHHLRSPRTDRVTSGGV